MNDQEKKKYRVGTIVSADLTVANAGELKDFYSAVIGWIPEPFKMKDEAGSYDDYVMKDSDENWIGGVCHARGANSDIPPQWIVYINVADIQTSIDKCIELGGSVLKESRNANGQLQYAMIKDPYGAVLAVTKEN